MFLLSFPTNQLVTLQQFVLNLSDNSGLGSVYYWNLINPVGYKCLDKILSGYSWQDLYGGWGGGGIRYALDQMGHQKTFILGVRWGPSDPQKAFYLPLHLVRCLNSNALQYHQQKSSKSSFQSPSPPYFRLQMTVSEMKSRKSQNL